MRRILLALMSTLAAVIMLFGYRTSTPNPASAATATVEAGTAGAGSSATTTNTPATPSPSTPGTAKDVAARTVTGRTVQTRWGPVQVQLTVAGKAITAVTVLQSPSGNDRDVEINSAALPVLQQETLKAQNAKIDTVSGATYTSTGYVSSLQSALDQAAL